MDYLSKRDRRRLAKNLIKQQIIEQAIDLERQREMDRRRKFKSIIDNDYNGHRHNNRSYSQTNGYRDNYYRQSTTSDSSGEKSRYRSGSLSHHRHPPHHHRSTESRECSLVTMTYSGSNNTKHSDEIIIIQRGRTLFKGCLKRGDQITFKSKRYPNESRLKFEFYINDILEDRIACCCEHSLINKNEKHFFQLDNILGSKPCHQCRRERNTSSSSLSSSSPITQPKQSLIVTNDRQRPLTTTINQRSSTTLIVNDSPKSKPSTSLNNQERENNDQQIRSEKKKPTTLSIPQTDVEKAVSEGFSADLSELAENQPSTTTRTENKQKPNEDSLDFLPVSPAPTKESLLLSPSKRVYGPPQVSTMLSVNEQVESSSESEVETHEEPSENPVYKRYESLNIEQKKVAQSDSDNDDNQNGPKESVQFLRSMSSNVETNPNQQTTSQVSSISINSSRTLTNANDATQQLLQRLGIVRQEQVEHSEASVDNAPRQRGNVEYFILVYLNSVHSDQSIVTKLRALVNFIRIFDDVDDCVAFINSIANEKVILITSDSYCSTVLPRIEDLQQIFTIYILSENEFDQDQSLLSKNQLKIKGFYTNLNDIIEQMADDINLVTRDLIAYMNISSNATTPDPMFTYSFLITEIILNGEETDYALKDLINFARQEYQGNEQELTIIDEFENDYQKGRAIWWFTRQCFLSKMLNKALRIPEADVLFKLRLFIQHLHEQIDNESISNQSVDVYLGQTIHQNDLDDLQKSSTNNGLLVFSQFLLGSTDLSRAIHTARTLPILSDEYTPVILHMNIPSNIKCANTSSLRYTVDDNNDVLLNMGMMGRLIKVEKDSSNENKISTIYLTLTKCENERNIQRLIEIKRNEIKGVAPFVSLIKLMIMMNQQTRAEQLVQMIFDDKFLICDPNLQGSLAASCHILGAACHARGDFKRAAELFHLSLDTFLRFVPSDAVQLSPTYNNIGSMYFRQEEYQKALEYHQKALEVQIKSQNPNLNSIASYANNVGVVQLKQRKYAEAARSFDRALKILQQLNQTNDPDLASTYDNLGDAYLLQDKYEDALTYYSKALEIQRHIQPHNPQALASFNNSIGNVYNKLHRYGDALVHFKRALEYQQEYLPPTYPSFASLYNNIGSMYYRQEQYADALPCYLKSLEIELMSLPENHPTIAVTHFNIATTYTGLGRFQEAVISTERSIEQLLKTLPPDHPEVIENQAYIETIKRKQMLKGLFETDNNNL